MLTCQNGIRYLATESEALSRKKARRNPARPRPTNRLAKSIPQEGVSLRAVMFVGGTPYGIETPRSSRTMLLARLLDRPHSCADRSPLLVQMAADAHWLAHWPVAEVEGVGLGRDPR